MIFLDTELITVAQRRAARDAEGVYWIYITNPYSSPAGLMCVSKCLWRAQDILFPEEKYMMVLPPILCTEATGSYFVFQHTFAF